MQRGMTLWMEPGKRQTAPSGLKYPNGMSGNKTGGTQLLCTTKAKERRAKARAKVFKEIATCAESGDILSVTATKAGAKAKEVRRAKERAKAKVCMVVEKQDIS